MVDYRVKFGIICDRLKVARLIALVITVLMLANVAISSSALVLFSQVGRYMQQLDETASLIRVIFFETYRNSPINQTRMSHSCRRSLKVVRARSIRCDYSAKLSTSRAK